MNVTKLLIANRGEIAIRIARAAADMGLPTVAVYSEDDARSLHLRTADEALALPGSGAAAYLNADAVIAAAKTRVRRHSPRLRLSGRTQRFRAPMRRAGLTFVGPDPEHLELFGDKARARIAAVRRVRAGDPRARSRRDTGRRPRTSSPRCARAAR